MAFLKKYHNSFYYLCSFLLPLTILAFILFTQNIYWNSPTTILASDGFHQYVIFAQNLRNILHGQDSLFYTFTSGLGLNFYALISYYLGSFLSPFVYFFNLETMPDAIYLFTLLKVGLMGTSSFYMLSNIYTKLYKPFALALSLSYSLMSFAMSQIEINMWLDAFILAPLIILGLHHLIEKQEITLYYLTLSILFIQNYYLGFMMALFLVLYSIAFLSRLTSWKMRLLNFVRFGFISILATLTSCVMLLPTYLDLSTHGEELTKLTNLFTENSWYLDFFAKNLVGSYDTTKFGAIPTIYVGLFPLFLTTIFFTLKQINWKVRLFYACLFALLIASFYLQPLDLFWQGMHAPNMFLHRYAWLFSLLMIIISGETLTYLQNSQLRRSLLGITILIIGFISTFIAKKHYPFLTNYLFIFTLVFTLVYTLLIISWKKNWFTRVIFASFTLLFTILEMTFNTHAQLTGIKDEWVFPTREGYNKQLIDITKLVSISKKRTRYFFRTERNLPQTGNDSMKFGYNGISQFSSIRNRLSSRVLDRLGYKSIGTNLNLRYQNNTIIADSLFGIKYLLVSENTPNNYGFSLISSGETVKLYENHNASQLAILTNSIYKDVKFTVNTLDNQTALLNQLTGLSERYFSRLPSQLTSGASQLDKTVTTQQVNNGTASVTYTFKTTAKSQVYLSMPNLLFSNTNQKNIAIAINGKTIHYTTDDAYSFFDLGEFDANENITATINFPENQRVSFQEPHFYGLNLANYQKAMDIINQKDVSVSTHYNQVITHYSSNKTSSLFFTLPYDDGWFAEIDGKKATIRKGQDGLMVIDVPKGKHKVTLTFIPNGLIIGMELSFLGISLFLCLLYAKTKRKKQ
ncbi:YfhO family protein [Streptococcus sciuri]|uniref:YfhO family protein n=1 Tax=Streptococcus sciuri TaxID=2973939 RepID=A0ABT2F6F4_9STRE|nr:YfhO family protein [Streptococcus sciuri]MCS4487970.1 YfhO family protein [Streptococcus sciuri]